MSILITAYVEKICTESPKRFCIDCGNDILAKQAQIDLGLDTTFSTMEKIVRAKNKFLENNPQYDFRVKNKGKNTGSVPTVEIAK